VSASFSDRLCHAVEETGTSLCVGIDPHLDRLPAPLTRGLDGLRGAEWRAAAAEACLRFSEHVVDACAGLVPAVKPQVAFFEALGAPGWAALEATHSLCRDAGLLTIVDAKRGDIGSTAAAYAQSLIASDGPLNADCATVSPYLGPEGLEPFVQICERDQKGLFALVRTSNPGAETLQHVGTPNVAERVGAWLESRGEALRGDHGLTSLGAVVGGTLPQDELHRLRVRFPSLWFLVPGYGAQGASADDIRTCFRTDGRGALIVSARNVLYPPTPEPEFDRNPTGSIQRRVLNMRKEL
jgi:orotidine-5'-phosphate decarboxylase